MHTYSNLFCSAMVSHQQKDDWTRESSYSSVEVQDSSLGHESQNHRLVWGCPINWRRGGTRVGCSAICIDRAEQSVLRLGSLGSIHIHSGISILDGMTARRSRREGGLWCSAEQVALFPVTGQTCAAMAWIIIIIIIIGRFGPAADRTSRFDRKTVIRDSVRTAQHSTAQHSRGAGSGEESRPQTRPRCRGRWWI
jgi:hypothetical protein